MSSPLSEAAERALSALHDHGELVRFAREGAAQGVWAPPYSKVDATGWPLSYFEPSTIFALQARGLVRITETQPAKWNPGYEFMSAVQLPKAPAKAKEAA